MNSIFEFDFDDWAELARRDPVAFDCRRDQVVETVCEYMGGRSKPAIAGICWRIDIERKRCTSPMQLCLKLSSLMWKRYADMADVLSDTQRLSVQMQSEDTCPRPVLKQPHAHLLSFPSSSVHPGR